MTWIQRARFLVLATLLASGCSFVVAADSGGSGGGYGTPSQPSVAERLANARKALEAKDWRIAAFELDKAVRADPTNADVHNLLGYYNRKRSTPDLQKAFEHYKAALTIDPRHKGAHEYIGEAFLMDRRPAEAEKHLAQLEIICGTQQCEEYQDLARAIATYKAANAY